MAITSTERHSLIVSAGEAAGMATALVGVLANEAAPIAFILSSITVLKAKVLELEANAITKIQD